MMTLSRVDKAALKLSIKACREEDPQRKAQIDLKLQKALREISLVAGFRIVLDLLCFLEMRFRYRP